MARRKPTTPNTLDDHVSEYCGVYGPEAIQSTLNWLKDAMNQEDYSPEKSTTPLEEIHHNLQDEYNRLEEQQDPNNYAKR